MWTTAKVFNVQNCWLLCFIYYLFSAVLSLSTSSILKWALSETSQQCCQKRHTQKRWKRGSYLFGLIPVQPPCVLARLCFGCRLHADQCGGTAGFGLMDDAASALETAGTLRDKQHWDTDTWRFCRNESKKTPQNSWHLDLIVPSIVKDENMLFLQMLQEVIFKGFATLIKFLWAFYIYFPSHDDFVFDFFW